MNKELDGYVKRLTSMRGGENSLEVYEDWATTYEKTMVNEYGYIAPQIAVDVLEKCKVGKNHNILDLGCGTGLVGTELFSRGYTVIDGVDISREMLKEARSKSIYRELIVGDLTKFIDFGGRSYDCLIGVGCFGNGHVGPEFMETITRYVRSDGILVLYMNGIPFLEDNYPSYFSELEEKQIWQILFLEKSNYMNGLDRPGWTVAARRVESSL